jgi:hypothetical protein
MTPRRLHELLGDIVRAPHAEAGADSLRGAWKIAEDEAVRAYEAWRESRRAEDYAVYTACAARADAAQDALARRAATAVAQP